MGKNIESKNVKPTSADLVEEMEQLFEISKNINDFKELEGIERKSNDIVLDLIHDMNNSEFDSKTVQKVLDLHQKIVFRGN